MEIEPQICSLRNINSMVQVELSIVDAFHNVAVQLNNDNIPIFKSIERSDFDVDDIVLFKVHSTI